MSHHDDFEREVQPGLPETLPDDERLLWQGSPDWRSLAIHALHLRKVAIYFSVLIVWVVAAGVHDATDLATLALPLNMLTLLGGCAMGVLALLAWASARSAVFTITNRRLVVRFGVALRLTLNLPFSKVDAVAVHVHGDRSGDVAIRLTRESKLSWLILWPFVRPWRLASPEVMLRSLKDPLAVATLLGDSLRRAAPAQPTTSDRVDARPPVMAVAS